MYLNINFSGTVRQGPVVTMEIKHLFMAAGVCGQSGATVQYSVISASNGDQDFVTIQSKRRNLNHH